MLKLEEERKTYLARINDLRDKAAEEWETMEAAETAEEEEAASDRYETLVAEIYRLEDIVDTINEAVAAMQALDEALADYSHLTGQEIWAMIHRG